MTTSTTRASLSPATESSTETTARAPDLLDGFLDGHHRWLDRLDISLVRHGVRVTGGPAVANATKRNGNGNTAGTYPTPAPASHRWLLDRSERDGGESAQPYRNTRLDTLAPCRVCLVRNVEAQEARDLIDLARMHPKLVFLCHDCRDLALEVGRLASARSRIDVPHTLEAFFRYVLPIDGPGISGVIISDDPDATVKQPMRIRGKVVE